MGSSGVKRRRTGEAEMVRHVEAMSEAVVDLVKSMKAENEVKDGALDARVEAMVRKELAETKQLIYQQSETMAELKNMLVMLRDRMKNVLEGRRAHVR